MPTENSYKCGCHYSGELPLCPYHNVPTNSQSGSNTFKSKKFKKNNQKIFVTEDLKKIKGKFDYIRITNYAKKIKPKNLKPFIHENTVLVVDCFDDKKCKKLYSELLPFAAVVTTLSIVDYAGKQLQANGYQLIFTSQSIPRLPVIAYRGSTALLESYWLYHFNVQTVFNPYATEDSVYIGAMKKKLSFVMQTDCYSLARSIVDNDYRALQLPGLDIENKVNPI